MFRAIRERLLAIHPDEASFDRRGFDRCDPGVRASLEGYIRAFVGGYNRSLKIVDPVVLAHSLEQEFDSHHVGFAFEGVGLNLALLDLLGLSAPNRLSSFIGGAGRDHDYIAVVGAGFAIARLPWGLRSMDRYVATLDPLIAWCVPDGYGFHEGFFRHRKFVDAAQPPPGRWSPYACQLFDSGIGRSLWWVKGADPARIQTAINGFAESRRAELWCGVGVAAAYAGGVSADVLLRLHELADPYQADFLSGIPFAARLRQKGRNPSAITRLACESLLGLTLDEAAGIAAAAAEEVASQTQGTGITGAYRMARKRLVNHPLISDGRRVIR